MKVDYLTEGQTDVDRAEDLHDLLSSHDGSPLRVLGGGSRQLELPPASKSVRLLRLSGMNRIHRLEAADLTCSVEPGLSRYDLDAALAEKGLQLPCTGGGSLGGLFASGEPSPMTPGAHSPRSLLLGMNCILAEGLEFKSGAKVVKNVAGYDLQKLFVGSRGLLFVATMLHLKLRPLVKHRAHLRRRSLEISRAFEIFTRLRHKPEGVSALCIHREDDGIALYLTMEGRTRSGIASLEKEGFEECKLPTLLGGERQNNNLELIRGQVRVSKVLELLAQLPESVAFSCSGTGQFECQASPDLSDSLLRSTFQLGGQAEIRRAKAERRGLSTAMDPAHQRLSNGLKMALDPGGVLH